MATDCFREGDEKPWAPYAPMIDHVISAARGAKRILDVGAGNRPFPLATHTADLVPRAFQNITSVQVNFRRRELPFENNYFDFVYCRHTFEDMDDPSRLIDEVQRVGRRGYIETPSPLSEVCRGIDGGSPAWRGYSHHRHLIWGHGDRLSILPKLPQIEHTNLSDLENISILKREPMLANTYFFWDGGFEVKFVWDEILSGFEAGQKVVTYQEAVNEAVAIGMQASRAALSLIG